MVGSSPKHRQSTAVHRVLRRVFPFLSWFDRYSLGHLRADLLAGLTVALVLVPQSMAYARLAGLPAYYGLYASVLPPITAAAFGSSHQLATGPVAVVSLLTAAALEPMATAGSTSFIAYAVVLSVLVGLFQLSLGLFRLGILVNFLSHSVITGFTNAAALIIATSQIAELFGVTIDKGDHHYETVYRAVAEAVRHTHWPTLALAVMAIAIMVTLRRINRKIPDVLVAVVVATLISWATGFHHDAVVSTERIQSSELRANVDTFNTAVVATEDAVSKRVELAAKARQAERATGKRSRAYLDLEYLQNQADLDVGMKTDGVRQARLALSSLVFERPAQAGGAVVFVQRGHAAPGASRDRRSWRLRVGNSKLDPNKLALSSGGAVVGEIPKGIRFAAPWLDRNGRPFSFWAIASTLLSTAIIISLLGFMEAISIAKAMATKTSQRIDPNQELIGQGLANLIGSVAQAYPVSGSFSRSAVNLQAGAQTGMSNVFSGLVVLVALFFLTPLLYHLPQSVLAAIILMAVIGLVNVHGFTHAWRAQRYDGIVSVAVFVCTLIFAPHLDTGILIGVGLSVGLYLLRNMQPDIALLSKHPDGSFRSASRHKLSVCKHIAVIRFNASLFFVNVNYLEEKILEQIATLPELRHVLIVGNGINELDASGEEMLSILAARLREAGYEVSLSGLNDSVLDVLRRTRLYERIGADHLFRNVAQAIETLHGSTHIGSSEVNCPLVHAPFKGIPAASGLKVNAEILGGPPGAKRERH
ncbi:MAG: STAS domain-containing protein [Nitrospirae bacterium]|nr:MAG: STAS domain-containing protein [Nitrospirota bacterium]